MDDQRTNSSVLQEQKIAIEMPNDHLIVSTEGVLECNPDANTQEVKDKYTNRFINTFKKHNLVTLLKIETHGIEPVSEEQRTDNRLYEMFFVWFSCNFNVLGFSTGTVGPAFFGLGLRDSLVVILIVDLISFIIPAYIATFGPKLGTRTMVQARFSWGYYGAMIPSILNVITLQGYLVLNTIIGGQTLASVSDRLSWSVGIVIISIISLFITFFGYRVIHWYESVAWIPNAIAFIVMLGLGGKHLLDAPESSPPTVAAILSFASTTASTDVSWCTMTADYGVYHNANTSSLRIFIYTYLGFFSSSVITHMLGAAFAASAPYVPIWNQAFQNGSNVGGLFYGILSPAGNFGKFLTVLVALSVPSICAPTMYSFSASFMNVSPFLARLPRAAYAIISASILIPLAIVGSTKFYSVFVDIFSIIGYWTASFSGIIVIEQFIFRRNNYKLYNIEDWKIAKRLPIGFAAIFAFFGSFAIIIPCMSQVWYVGPIAKAGTGDIGIFVAFASAAVLYLVLRPLELKMRKDTSFYSQESVSSSEEKIEGSEIEHQQNLGGPKAA